MEPLVVAIGKYSGDLKVAWRRCAVAIGESMIAGDDVWSQSARAQLAALLIAEGITPLRARGREVLTAGDVNAPAER